MYKVFLECEKKFLKSLLSNLSLSVAKVFLFSIFFSDNVINHHDHIGYIYKK